MGECARAGESVTVGESGDAGESSKPASRSATFPFASPKSTTFTWSPGYGWGPSAYGYPGWGYWGGEGWGYSGPSYGLYGGWARRTPTYIFRPAPNSAYYPGPASSSKPVSDGTGIDRDLEAGRRLFRLGDYRSALDAFRAAVTASSDHPSALAHFALALIVSGDGRNADKALRKAAGSPASSQVAAAGLVKDERERQRLTALLSRIGGEGALSAAWVLAQLGDPSRLNALGAKDPDALKLQAP